MGNNVCGADSDAMDPELPSFLRQPGHRREDDVVEREASQSSPQLASSSPHSVLLTATTPSFRFVGVPNAPPHKGSTSSLQQSVQRRFVRQPMPSSSSSANTLHATLPPLHKSPPALPLMPVMVTAPNTPTMQPLSPDSKGHRRDTVEGSTCSAFSLYSAESTTRDLPLLPPPLERVTLFRSISPATSGTDRPAVSKTATLQGCATASATTSFGANTTIDSLPGADDASAQKSRVPSPIINPFRRKKSSRLSEAQSVAEGGGGEYRLEAAMRGASTATLEGAPSAWTMDSGSSFTTASTVTTATTTTTNATTALTASPKTAHLVSNALLDLSFDSRAFAAGDAKRGCEIRRLGVRLQELQHEHSLLTSASPARLTPPGRRAGGGGHADTTELLEGFSDCFSRAATAVDRASASTTQGSASPTESGVARTHLYAETVKFVHLIREIHDARSAARSGYTWFRWGTLPPILAPGSGDVDAPSSLASGAVPLSVTPSTQPSASQHDSVTAAVTVTEAQLRSSLTRRDPKKALVQWNPYELRESDPSPTSPMSPECFCGYQAGNVLADGAGAISATEQSRLLDMGFATTRSGDAFIESRVTLPSAFSESETPPLPTTSQPSARPSTCNASSVRENLPLLNESNGTRSSSAGPTRTTSGSTSNESLPFCPFHVPHRPPSILVRGKPDRSHNPFVTSPTRQQQAALELMQVDVPSSAPAPTPTPNKLTGPRTPGPTARRAASSLFLGGSTARHSIIGAGVPHRRQLAKRALEDNQLFFELRSKQRTGS